MLDYKIIDNEIVEELFSNSKKLILKINSNLEIIDYNDAFEELNFLGNNISDLITYTHIKEFKKRVNNLNKTDSIAKFLSNFSFDKENVEDIPNSYEIILKLNEDESITLIAEPMLPLSHSDAKVYLSLINDFSKTSRELTKTKQRLQYLNANLQEEVEKRVQEIREKDELILKQSKDAIMGEMIDSVAHQWKSPLGVIKLLAETIKLELEFFETPNLENILDDSKKIEEQVDHLVETLDEFRNFFRPITQLENVCLFNIAESVKVLMHDELIKNNITIDINDSSNRKVNLITNQFKHVLINLISNSKDAFVENSVEHREIEIRIFDEEEFVILEFQDNAGGIPENLFEKIFEDNFTTKEVGKGTGIGLFMSKRILEKIDAEIKVFNKDQGSVFRVVFTNISE